MKRFDVFISVSSKRIICFKIDLITYMQFFEHVILLQYNIDNLFHSYLIPTDR